MNKNEWIRRKIKELHDKGIQYKLFYTACGIGKDRFYNFTSGKAGLKKEELFILEHYLEDNFNIQK